MVSTKSRWRFAAACTAMVIGGALIAAACGGGTSSADKTATAGAGGAKTTPAATSAATKAATAAATSAATKSATTPAAGATTGATAPSGTVTGAAVGDSTLGKILVDSKGFTLYTFKNDVAGNGKSAAEALAANWPPFSLTAAPTSVTGATGTWAMFTRVDGKTQVTYNGLPLYYFANDKAPGDTKGDKVAGIWFVAVP